MITFFIDYLNARRLSCVKRVPKCSQGRNVQIPLVLLGRQHLIDNR